MTPACQDFCALEAAASQILAWDPQRVPDLLQTRDYAQALAAAGPRPAASTGREEAGGILATRQHAVLMQRHADITAVVTETALRRPVAGPSVMRAQLSALAELAANSGHVTICLLPPDRGAQAAATGPVTILRFGEATGVAAAHLPGPQGGTFLDTPADLAACARVFEELKACALTPAASARLLRELAVQ